MGELLLRRAKSRSRAGNPDRGAALLTVIMFLAVVGALGSLATLVGISGLRNASRDVAGAAAAATTNAGAAEGISYIRTHGLSTLTCMEPFTSSSTTWESAAGCTSTSNHWAKPTSPQTVCAGVDVSAPVAGEDCYLVWIGTLQLYIPPAGQPGAAGYTPAQPAIVRIHSTGISGNGPAGRSINADVSITPSQFPIGVFGNTFNQNSTNPPISNESLYAAGNVSLSCELTGIDPEYNIPAAVHAGGTISYGTARNCTEGVNPTVVSGTTQGACPLSGTAPLDAFDQSSTGGPYPTTSPCYNYDTNTSYPYYSSTLTPYANTSYFSENELSAYGYRPGGLSADEYSQLQAEAISEGTYNVTGTALTSQLNALVSAGITNPVVFDNNGSYPSLKDFPAAFAATSGTTCGDSVTVVVQNSPVHWQDGSLTGSVFVPDGEFETTGNMTLLGTLFAQSLAFEGVGNKIYLDSCFVNSPPAGVLSLTVLHVRNVDTGNLGG